MKKAVAHLIPFMEKERQERREQRKAEGLTGEDEADVSLPLPFILVLRERCSSCFQGQGNGN